MTNNNKQEKAPKDVQLLKEPIDKISDEKASPSVTNFKSKFWRYGLLTFIIVLSLIYVIVNPSFDTNSIPNKFKKAWNTGLNSLLTSEEKPTDSSILKNIDSADKAQPNAYAAKTNLFNNNISNLENYSNDISNAELVKKSQFGDKSAFEQLVVRHQELVFSLAYKLTGTREMANDVAQESFIRAWKAIEKFRGDSTFSTWIYCITVNTAWTLRKKAKKHNTLNIEDTYEPVIIDEKKDPELVAINSDLSSVLVGALDKIPIDQRIIVELKNIEGRSHKEIAEILGISVTAAKVRLHRAHQKLRQILEEVER